VCVCVCVCVCVQLLGMLNSMPPLATAPEPKGFSEKKPPLVAVYTWCAVLTLLKKADVRSSPDHPYRSEGLETRRLESRAKASASSVIEVAAGWASSSSHGL
jgi:hypothetical protein